MSESKQKNLTQEEIFDICDRLLESGVKPTNQRIRDEAGGRGSNSTVDSYSNPK
jgi:hypothetical protein